MKKKTKVSTFTVKLIMLDDRTGMCAISAIDGEMPSVVMFCNQSFVLNKNEYLWVYKEVSTARTLSIRWDKPKPIEAPVTFRDQ